MGKDINKFIQNLDGCQIVREEIVFKDSGIVCPRSALARLGERRRREADIHLTLKRMEFKCPHCGCGKVSVYKGRERTAKGVPNGNIPVILHFVSHRIYCHECHRRTGERFRFLPTQNSHITRQLMKTIVALRSEMSIKAIAEYFGVSWDLVKDTEKEQLRKDYSRVPLKHVKAIGIDEIYVFRTAKSNEKYVTVVRDLETGDVLFVGDGKGEAALAEFSKRLRRWRKHIAFVCMDMSNSYSAWVEKNLPNAEIVFDHFHVIKAMNDALDKIRRRTAAKADDETRKLLKGGRFLLTGNQEDLSAKGAETLETIRGNFGELSDAYGLKEHLRAIYTFARIEYGARLLLEDWCETARAADIPELICMAKMIERHMEGILGYWRHGRASNAKVEGFNNKIRWLVRQAYGLRDREYFKLKVYSLPHTETRKAL